MRALLLSQPLSNRQYGNTTGQTVAPDKAESKESLYLNNSLFCDMYTHPGETLNKTDQCVTIKSGVIANDPQVRRLHNLDYGIEKTDTLLGLYVLKNQQRRLSSPFLEALRDIGGKITFFIGDKASASFYCYSNHQLLYYCSNLKNYSLTIGNLPYPSQLHEDLFSPYKLITTPPRVGMFITKTRDSLIYRQFTV